MAGYTHTTTDADGIRNHHFEARPLMSMEAARRAPQMNFGRRNFARPHRYRYDPESDLRDPTIRERRAGLR